MDKTVKKSHPLRMVLLILLILILLILASPFLYDLIGGYRDYDDIPALISSAGPMNLTVREDGVVCFDADKPAVYAYAAEVQLMDRLLDNLERLPLVSEKTVSFSKFGYSLCDDELSASVKLKLFGFLPVQLHAEAFAAFSPDELELTLSSLKYGRWIDIPYEEYAVSFDMPELTDGFVIDASDFYGELYPLKISAGNDTVSFQCDILNQTVRNVGDTGAVLAELMPLFLNTDTDAAKVLRGEGSGVYASITDSVALSDLLTGLLKFAPAGNAPEFKNSLNDTPFLGLELGDISSTYAAQISIIISDYEVKLTALREAYKEYRFHISKEGFCTEDGAAAESALQESWGARIVLQFNRDFNSIVKANDGIFSAPLNKWTVLPNPVLAEIRRDKGVALPKNDGIKVYDLTLAVRLPDDTPAIIFLTATDEFGINVIPEELYEEILSGGPLPCYCSADIVAPNQYHFVTADAEQRDFVIYLP